MHLLSSQVIQDVILLPSDTQHVDIELAAEAGLYDGPVDHRRCWHYKDLGHSYVEEVEGWI